MKSVEWLLEQADKKIRDVNHSQYKSFDSEQEYKAHQARIKEFAKQAKAFQEQAFDRELMLEKVRASNNIKVLYATEKLKTLWKRYDNGETDIQHELGEILKMLEEGI